MKPKSETKKKMRRRSTRHTTREIRARQDARSRQRLRWKSQRHDLRNEKQRSLKGKNERTRKRRRNSKFFDFLEGALALTQEDFEASRDLHSEMSPNFFLACLRFGIASRTHLRPLISASSFVIRGADVSFRVFRAPAHIYLKT